MRFVHYKRLLGLFFASISSLSLAKVDTEGNNGLMRAARQGDSKKVGKLLVVKYSGSIINQQNYNGNTALMLAVMSRNAPTVEKLLAHNVVDLGLKNKQGKTALDLALELANGHKEDAIVQLLKNHKPRGVEPRSGNGKNGTGPQRLPFSIWQ